MVKLKRCRICLVENVRMHVVTNRNLQQVYEKLSDVPFITEDHRPMLACFFCYTKLKQCWQLQRKCLEAEEVFAQMLNEDYVEYTLTNRGQLELIGRFIKTPIELISIAGVSEEESVAIKEELPDVSETQHYIEIKDEPLTEVPWSVNKPKNRPEPEVYLLPHSSEFDSEDEVPLFQFAEVKEEQAVPLKETNWSPATMEIRHVDEITPQQSNGLQEWTKSSTSKSQALESATKFKNSNTETKTVHNSTIVSKNLEDLDNSININIIEKCYKCNICQKKFASISNLNQHSIEHTVEKPYKCNICQKTFASISNLNQHSIEHTVEKPYECDICKHDCNQTCDLFKRMLVHTGSRPFKCDLCGRTFNSVNDLNQHMRVHPMEKPYKCDKCQSRFIDTISLEQHIRSHTDVTLYVSDACQEVFRRTEHLHDIDSNVDISKSWPIPQEEEESLQVDTHRPHTGVKLYYCDFCKRGFRKKHSLPNHFRTHSDDKPYKCDICQRSFKYKANLKAHTRIHTIGVERPHKCDICQKTYIKKDALTSHMRVHTRERPYKCSICPLSFFKKLHLKAHTRTHTNERPYQCDVCQQNFAKRLHLILHSRTHTRPALKGSNNIKNRVKKVSTTSETSEISRK